MKKFIALLLALVMAFSVSAVAFAANGNAGAGVTAQSDGRTFGDLGMTEEEIIDFVMNPPAGSALQSAKLTLKFAKLAVKIVLVLDKVHLIDLTPLKNAILEWIADLIEDAVRNQRPENPEVPAEVAQIVEMYNNAIAKAKATGDMTVEKINDVQIELTDCSIQSSVNLITPIIEQFTGVTVNTWTFFGGKGTNKDGETTTANKLISPTDRAATLFGADVASATVSEDGRNFTITLKSEVSLFDGKTTVYPAGNYSVIDPFDPADMDLPSSFTVKSAEMTYTETVLKVTLDDSGRLTQLNIYVPVTISALGSISRFNEVSAMFELSYKDTFTFTY